MADQQPATGEMPEVRPAKDAEDDKRLKRDPGDEDAKLDIALDESFPTSDAPSNTQPGKGSDPASTERIAGGDAPAPRFFLSLRLYDAVVAPQQKT